MSELYLVRTPRGLTLHQRQPKCYSRNGSWSGHMTIRYARKTDPQGRAVFAHGQVFRINEFPGSEHVLLSNDNMTMMRAELYIPRPHRTLHQEL